LRLGTHPTPKQPEKKRKHAFLSTKVCVRGVVGMEIG
jgi:hypothetical protein